MKRPKRILLVNSIRKLVGLPVKGAVFFLRVEILEIVNYITNLQKTIEELEDRLDNLEGKHHG